MWNVYISGNFDVIVAAYNALAMMFSDSHNIYSGAAILSLLMLLISALTKLTDDNQKPVHNFFFGLIMFIILTGPATRATVVVESRTTAQVQTIDNVPLLVAITGSIATSLLSQITDDFRTAFQDITPIGSGVTASGYGGLDPLRALVKMNQEDYANSVVCLAHGNLDLCRTLVNYVRDCVGRDILTGGPGQEASWTRIMNAGPADALVALKSTNPMWTTQSVPKTGQPVDASCKDTYTQIATVMNGPEFRTSVDKYNQAVGINGNDLENMAGIFTGSAMSHYDMAVQRLTWHVVKEGMTQANDKLGVQVEEMQFTAKEQRLVKMASSYELFNELAPALITFFEFFAIFISPVMLLMIVTGRMGMQAAGSYIMFVLFTNLWPLMAVGVESYMQFALASDMSSATAYGPAAMSWNGTPGMVEKAQTYLAVGSTMMAAIPSLAMAVLFKGVHGMAGMAGKSSPEAPVNAHYVAPNVTSAPDNGKTSQGQQNVTYDPMSNTGSSLSGAQNYSSILNAGQAVSQELSSGIAAAKTKSEQSLAQVSDSVSKMYSAGNSVMNSSTASESEKAQIGRQMQVSQAVTKAYMQATGKSNAEASADIVNNSSAVSKAIEAHGGVEMPSLGGLNPVKAGAGVSMAHTATDTEGNSKTNTTSTNEQATRSGSSSGNVSRGVSDLVEEAKAFTTNKSLQNNAEFKEASANLVQSSKSYAEAKQVTEQMSTAQKAVQQGGLSASVNLGQAGQRGYYNAQDMVSNLAKADGNTKESLVQRGIIDGDGNLTDQSKARINELSKIAHNASDKQLSEVQAGSIASATFMAESGVQLMGGRDKDDLAAAAQVFTALNAVREDAGFSQMAQVASAASHTDEVKAFGGVSSTGLATTQQRVAVGSDQVENKAGAEMTSMGNEVGQGKTEVQHTAANNNGTVSREISDVGRANSPNTYVYGPSEAQTGLIDMQNRMLGTDNLPTDESVNTKGENLKENIAISNIVSDWSGIRPSLETVQNGRDAVNEAKEVGKAALEKVAENLPEPVAKSLDKMEQDFKTAKEQLGSAADTLNPFSGSTESKEEPTQAPKPRDKVVS